MGGLNTILGFDTRVINTSHSISTRCPESPQCQSSEWQFLTPPQLNLRVCVFSLSSLCVMDAEPVSHIITTHSLNHSITHSLLLLIPLIVCGVCGTTCQICPCNHVIPWGAAQRKCSLSGCGLIVIACSCITHNCLSLSDCSDSNRPGCLTNASRNIEDQKTQITEKNKQQVTTARERANQQSTYQETLCTELEQWKRSGSGWMEQHDALPVYKSYALMPSRNWLQQPSGKQKKDKNKMYIF